MRFQKGFFKLICISQDKLWPHSQARGQPSYGLTAVSLCHWGVVPTARHLVTKCSCWPSLSQAHLLEGHGHLSKPPHPQVWGTGAKPERADWEVPDWTSALLRSPWGRAHGHSSLLSLLSRNNRRKDACKCFWLPQPGCLSERSADTPGAKLGAEGLPSKSSAGTLWGEAMVSKGTK